MPIKYADFEPTQRHLLNAKDAGMSADDIEVMQAGVAELVKQGAPENVARALAFMTVSMKVPPKARYTDLP